MATMLHDSKRTGRTVLGSVRERAEHALEIAKARMGPLHEQARHVYHAAESAFSHEGESEGEGGGEAGRRDLASMLSTLSTLAKGFGLVVTVVKAVQHHDPYKGIPWRWPPARKLLGSLSALEGFPWRRPPRRSLLGSLALFGAGAAAGAGAMLLFAPRAGHDTRAGVLRKLERLKQEAMHAIDEAAAPDGGVRSQRTVPPTVRGQGMGV